MKHLHLTLLAAAMLLGAGFAQAADLSIDLQPDPANPTNPTMGNWMHFASVIHNNGAAPVEGLVA